MALSHFFHSLSYFKRFKTGEVYGPAFPGLYGLHKFGYGGEISLYFSGVNADLHRAVGIAGAELLEACLYAGIQSLTVLKGVVLPLSTSTPVMPFSVNSISPRPRLLAR